MINYVKWKGYDSSFNSWIDKKDIAKTSEYFPKPNSLEKNVKVEMDLSNYAAKTDIKNSIRIDTSSFAKKVDLASLKSDVDKLDINKLKNVPTNLKNLKSKVHKLDVHKLVPVPVELSKLSDVVKNDVVKKDVYNAKIKNIEYKIADITNWATNASLNAKINDVKDEIPDITNLATKASLHAKINEVKSEIPNITNWATTSAPTAVENKIPYVSSLVSKSDIVNFVNKTDFDNKVEDVTSIINELSELTKKVKAISTKILTKYLIDRLVFLMEQNIFLLEYFRTI